MENGLTQEQVGRMIGVTTQAVSKWERGSTPDAEILPLMNAAWCFSLQKSCAKCSRRTRIVTPSAFAGRSR